MFRNYYQVVVSCCSAILYSIKVSCCSAIRYSESPSAHVLGFKVYLNVFCLFSEKCLCLSYGGSFIAYGACLQRLTQTLSKLALGAGLASRPTGLKRTQRIATHCNTLQHTANESCRTREGEYIDESLHLDIVQLQIFVFVVFLDEIKLHIHVPTERGGEQVSERAET